MNDNTEKAIAASIFNHHGETFEHASFDREIAFYESICSGNLELVKVFYLPLFSEGCGILSTDSLRNLKYHFVISTALIARSCVNGGMTPEESYSISDHFIMRADKASTEEEVRTLHTEMIEKYTTNMRRVKLSGVYSKQIVRAIDYIISHLHSRIMINDAAEHLKLSPSYLSRLFKAETGMTFSSYINKAKAEEAANLLMFTGYTDLEISSMFAFSSQSHFIRIFRKYIGTTPKEYKKKYRSGKTQKNSDK